MPLRTAQLYKSLDNKSVTAWPVKRTSSHSVSNGEPLARLVEIADPLPRRDKPPGIPQATRVRLLPPTAGASGLPPRRPRPKGR